MGSLLSLIATQCTHGYMWVGHLFTYVKTCERGRVKDFEQRSHAYNATIMESQCIKVLLVNIL